MAWKWSDTFRDPKDIAIDFINIVLSAAFYFVVFVFLIFPLFLLSPGSDPRPTPIDRWYFGIVFFLLAAHLMLCYWAPARRPKEDVPLIYQWWYFYRWIIAIIHGVFITSVCLTIVLFIFSVAEGVSAGPPFESRPLNHPILATIIGLALGVGLTYLMHGFMWYVTERILNHKYEVERARRREEALR
jgi:hypothetical protein